MWCNRPAAFICEKSPDFLAVCKASPEEPVKPSEEAETSQQVKITKEVETADQTETAVQVKTVDQAEMES